MVHHLPSHLEGMGVGRKRLLLSSVGVHDRHCSTAPRRDRGGNAILIFLLHFIPPSSGVPNK
jgi:hypothetical protein